LLPVSPANEVAFYDLVSATLETIGVVEDKAEWISLQLRRWKNDGAPDPAFRDLVRKLLFDPAREPPSYVFDDYGGPNGAKYQASAQSLAQQYFPLHSRLCSAHLVTHEGTRQLLSYAGLIARLAIEERMSASEICRLLVARDSRSALNWKIVQAILQATGQSPDLKIERTREVFQADTDAEPLLLGDLDIPGAILRVGEIAASLGCIGPVSDWLFDLLIKEPHEPFLVILHYQLVIQAEYDHALSYAYEFSPRGQAVKWLTERYRDAGIPVARDAYLNNAKAVLRFDEAWITGRADNLRAATALAKLLRAMEELAPVSKSELSCQIRGLLVRHLRLETERNDGDIPNRLGALTGQDREAILAAASARNTRTTGIVEQRLVDTFGVKNHPAHDGWSVRGLGQSVFAANVPAKKLGDVEFELADRQGPRIEAYEAHGGMLTLPYVLDHLDSFAAVLELRRQDLESIAALANWQLAVTFVAHQFGPGLPASKNVEGSNVNLRYISFADLVAGIDPTADAGLFETYFVGKLNEGFVHPFVRARVLDWIA
jgi:hypothetical protein